MDGLSQFNLGHELMALCALLYLVWWIIFFRPNKGNVRGTLYGFGAGSLIVAAIAGITGVIFIAMGTSALAQGSQLSGWWFVLGAIIAYIVFAWFTFRILNRPITTELVLFVAWAALELYVACGLLAGGIIDASTLGWLIALIICIFAMSLVCYVLYYRLAPLPSFVDGALPLVAVGLFSIIFVVML